MRVSPALTNFTAGEWSPQLLGQIDLEAYPNACSLMRNFICRVHGGAQKRPGTIFVGEVKNSAQSVRLIPFQYSTAQAYVLEMGDSYIRFFKDRGQIVNGDDSPYEIGSCYLEADVERVKYAQDKDLMYLFNQYYPPQKLTRYDHDDWEMINAPFVNGPYLPQKRAIEIGANLQTNGGFEEDTGITSIGTPEFQERSSVRVYEGTYSRMLAGSADSQGFTLPAFTSVTSSAYVVRFRVFTRAGSLTLQVKQGDESGTYMINEAIEEIPENEWSEFSRYYTEAAGGATAQIGFLSATESLDDNLCPNPGFESAVESTWYKVGQLGTEFSHRSNAQKKSGTYSYRFRGDGIGNRMGVRSNPWITETGKVYKVSFWVYTSGGSVRMSIRRGNDADYTQVDYNSVPNSSWTQYTYYYKETDGGASCHLMFDTVGLDYRYVDDITFQEVKTLYYIDKVEVLKVDAITITPSATTGTVTLTASDDIFQSGHIGAFWQLTHGETTGYGIVSGYTSAKVVSIDVIEPFGATTATAEWREGAWSAVNGWPACGAFYEQRLMTASSWRDQDALWGSRMTEYEDFTPGVLDTDAVSYKLQSDIIRWLAPMGQLVAGTVNAEYQVGSQSSDEPMTPKNIRMLTRSRKGSASLDPINLGSSILFVQRRGDAENYGKRLRELSYNYINESFDGIDLTLFAEHITGSGIKRTAFMSSPYPILWAATADGRLIAMTYEREQKVIGWHYHPTEGVVEDLCVVPGENQDDLYLLVAREVNGDTKKYVEVLADFDFGDIEDAFFVDCGLSYDGEPTDALAGLDHLEGCEVAVLADGKVHPNCTVSGGEITLDYEASKVHAGLPYVSELEPFDLQSATMEGVGQGKAKRIHGVTLYLYQSGGGEIGQDEDATERIFYKEEAEAGDEALPLFTGLKDDFGFAGDWGLRGLVYIKHDDPLPFTVLSILPRFRVEDR